MVSKNYCKKGHEFTEENTYINHTTKKRRCKICLKNYQVKNKDKINSRSTNWQKENRKRANEISNRWKRKNHDKVNQSRKRWFPQYKATLRIEVLTHYGSNRLSCICCNESLIQLLTLDHINGIKKTEDNGRRSWMLLQYLRANNYPEGYQTLCWNCNSGRANNGGICPHKTDEVIIFNNKLRSLNPNKHTLRMRKYMPKYVKKLRIETLAHYGKGRLECLCCRINKIQFLTLDHINGRKKHEQKNLKFRGWQLMRVLRKEGYPEGYQTLCWNCNSGRQLNGGICPHQQVKKD